MYRDLRQTSQWRSNMKRDIAEYVDVLLVKESKLSINDLMVN